MSFAGRVCLWLCVTVICVGCATTPELAEQRRTQELTVEKILSEPLDESAYGKTKRCLRSNEYRSFRVLDDRHILFSGSRGRMWLNVLPHRCSDLRHATTLAIKSVPIGSRICALDTFKAGDWFEWPWYRRWPWRWGTSWDAKMSCSLSEFQPVTQTQVAAIDQALKGDR